MTTATEDPHVAKSHTTSGFDRQGRAHRDRTSPSSILLLLLMPLSIVAVILLLAWLTGLQGLRG